MINRRKTSLSKQKSFSEKFSDQNFAYGDGDDHTPTTTWLETWLLGFKMPKNKFCDSWPDHNTFRTGVRKSENHIEIPYGEASSVFDIYQMIDVRDK